MFHVIIFVLQILVFLFSAVFDGSLSFASPTVYSFFSLLLLLLLQILFLSLNILVTPVRFVHSLSPSPLSFNFLILNFLFLGPVLGWMISSWIFMCEKTPLPHIGRLRDVNKKEERNRCLASPFRPLPICPVECLVALVESLPSPPACTILEVCFTDRPINIINNTKLYRYQIPCFYHTSFPFKIFWHWS